MKLLRYNSRKPIFFVVVLIIQFLSCQQFSNPFERYDNADMHIMEKTTTFSTNLTDTLDMFSNDTLYLAATVPELIDSFSINVSDNRDFLTKTIISPTARSYGFRISAYDTGNQTITINVYRKDKDSTSRNILFYAKNPLSQGDLIGQNLNDSITLKTNPVEDLRVWYTWVLDYHVVRSPFSLVHTKTTQMDKNERIGHLYVSDSLYKSPDVTFKFSFEDKIPPTITCTNDGYDTTSKTVQTSDSIFIFRVHVDDGNEQKVASVRFNGSMPEYFTNNIYSKVLNNAYTFTQDHPYIMQVQAVDNEAFDNIANDTFKIIFNPSFTKKDTTLISINKIYGDNLITAANPIILNGSVSNSSGQQVILNVFLNDSLIFNTSFLNGSGIWNHSFNLQNESNELILKAFNDKATLLTEKKLTIHYSTQTIDTVPPVLLSILVNNIEANPIYVNKNSAVISLSVFDFGSGIRSLDIYNEPQTVSESQHVWQKNIYNLEHKWNIIAIKTEDLKGNRKIDSVSIFYNRLPSVIQDPMLPFAIRIDTMYNSAFNLSDPDDKDSPKVIVVHSPPDVKFSDDLSQFTWSPVLEHIGDDSIVVRIFDGNQNSDKFVWPYRVYNPASSKTSIQLSDKQDIPEFLRAGQDSLDLIIKFGEASGTPPYNSHLQIRKNSGLFEYSSKDTKLKWVPTTEDTGICQLRILVTDELRHSDTTFAQVLVVRQNNDPANLILKNFTNALFVDSNHLFLGMSDSQSVLNFEIRDEDHPITESYSVSVTMNGSTTQFTPAEKYFHFSVTPKTFTNDSVTVTLMDKTRIIPDSMSFIIINPVDSPISLPGLERWFIPENYISTFRITAWKDYFDSENDLAPNDNISINKSGLNGHQTIKLNSSYLTDLNTENWMSGPFSIFILAKYDSLPNSNQALISNFNSEFASAFSIGLSATGQAIAYTGSYQYPNTVKTSLMTIANSWYIYSFISTGISEAQTLSVKVGINRAFDEISINNVPDESSISIGSNNRSTKWSGELAEIIQYNRKLSSAECTRVIGYLMKKYGIQ